MAFTHKLARDLFIVTMILCIVLIAPVAYLSSQARRDISEQFIDNATSLAVSEYKALADSMAATLSLVRDWGDTELFALSNTEALRRLLFPVFDRERVLYGISVADIDGNSYYVRRHETGWRSSKTVADKTPGAPRLSMVTLWDAEQKQQQQEKQATDYDPRNRPWFAPALAQDAIFWTEPYKFYSSEEVGITASVSYTRKKDNKQVVVAFDIVLDDLFTEIHNLAPSDHSRVFIFRRDSQLYVPKSLEHPPDFLTITSVQDTLVRQAYANWVGESHQESRIITLQHDGITWWAGFLPLEDQRRTTWICVMVPEDDILARAGQRKIQLWLFALSTFLVVAGLTLWISRRHGRAVIAEGYELVDRDDPQTGIQQVIASGEGPTVEFKATLRMNLHAKRPGKEIELAWLKSVAAFLNTEGGTLLLGVTDHGQITGLEQDVFENEDKCKLHFKNLIAEHIGAEFSKYIDFQIYQLDDHTVGVVNCGRSPEPVFLKANKSEVFYIRNGPSSDELPGSKVLNYIKSRQ